MNLLSSVERDRLLQQLGSSDACVHQLKQRIARQCEEWESPAREWQRFLRHERDLGEWLVDAATDDTGELIMPRIDAALGGERCVPCTFYIEANGKRYHLELVSTEYEVKEV